MEWIRFIIDFMFVPAILVIVGLIGGIVLLLVRKKIKKKSLLIAGIAAFAVAAVCIIYITGYLLIYIIGGSLFGEGSLSPQYRSDWIDDKVVGVITEDNNVMSVKIIPAIQEYKGDNMDEMEPPLSYGRN